MNVEDNLKSKIIDKYGSVKHFSEVAGIPYQTVVSILNRGIMKSGLQNVIDMCRELDISVDALCEGKIIRNAPVDPEKAKKTSDLFDLIEAYVYFYESYGDCTLDGEELTLEEMDAFLDGINLIIDQIRAKRLRENGKRISKLDRKVKR